VANQVALCRVQLGERLMESDISARVSSDTSSNILEQLLRAANVAGAAARDRQSPGALSVLGSDASEHCYVGRLEHARALVSALERHTLAGARVLATIRPAPDYPRINRCLTMRQSNVLELETDDGVALVAIDEVTQGYGPCRIAGALGPVRADDFRRGAGAGDDLQLDVVRRDVEQLAEFSKKRPGNVVRAAQVMKLPAPSYRHRAQQRLGIVVTDPERTGADHRLRPHSGNVNRDLFGVCQTRVRLAISEQEAAGEHCVRHTWGNRPTAGQPACMQGGPAACLNSQDLGSQARPDLARRRRTFLEHVNLIVKDYRRNAIRLRQSVQYRECSLACRFNLRSAHGAAAVEHQADRQRRSGSRRFGPSNAHLKVDVAKAANADQAPFRPQLELHSGPTVVSWLLGVGGIHIMRHGCLLLIRTRTSSTAPICSARY
jgi:hypothetical protein